ncbi:RNA polymerase sigma factor [Olivibacter sitiensis]|uniref:RNA polymerase sigma factor n=1 Tax=Olivibacter sitiensis TaxID=376470 RepID=UPI00041B9875|nr:sigma-70 family RNA polymerase sigma factor [Olivibacter sitiensis]
MSDLYVMVEEQRSKVTKSIQHYGKELLGFIRKRVRSDADAEDILQDVWYQLSAVVNAQPVEQMGAWLYKVARNKIIDKHRKKTETVWEPKKMGSEEDLEIEDLYLISNNTPETAYESNEVWKQLFLALEELPPKQRDVFVWHELDQIPFAQIADITGEPVGKLISRKRYAVLHLRKRLKLLYSEIVSK